MAGLPSSMKTRKVMKRFNAGAVHCTIWSVGTSNAPLGRISFDQRRFAPQDIPSILRCLENTRRWLVEEAIEASGEDTPFQWGSESVACETKRFATQGANRQQAVALEVRRMHKQQTIGTGTGHDIEPHAVGMGQHYIWRYERPIVSYETGEDGWTERFDEEGQTSEGCIMLLVDDLARRELGGLSAQDICREACGDTVWDSSPGYATWLESSVLEEKWGRFTIIPEEWTIMNVICLLSDLRTVGFEELAEILRRLVEREAPHLLPAEG